MGIMSMKIIVKKAISKTNGAAARTLPPPAGFGIPQYLLVRSHNRNLAVHFIHPNFA